MLPMFIFTNILTQIIKYINVLNVHHSFSKNDYNLESFMAYIGLR